MQLKPKLSLLIASVIYDLVPRSRFGGSRTKKQGRGEGKGEEETRSGKIRLRGSESASTAHAQNLTCFDVYIRYMRCVLL